MYDLNDVFAELMSDGTSPGFIELSVAYGINNSGQIVGVGS